MLLSLLRGKNYTIPGSSLYCITFYNPKHMCSLDSRPSYFILASSLNDYGDSNRVLRVLKERDSEKYDDYFCLLMTGLYMKTEYTLVVDVKMKMQSKCYTSSL